MLQTLIRCCAGLDVHRSIVVVTLLKSQPDEQITKKVREFSAFRLSLQEMARWLKVEGVDLAVMESTGIYWKAVFEALEDEAIDRQVFAAMESYQEEWQLAQTLPGMDQTSAAMLLVETGVDMSRFGSGDRLSSWAGMCPGNNESAGKRKTGRSRKGNRYVRAILCEVANAARKTDSQFKGLYQGLVVRRGHKRAIIAVGHRILEIVYLLLSRKEPYKDPCVDYEALMVKRNVPRWIEALRKYGYIPEQGHEIAL